MKKKFAQRIFLLVAFLVLPALAAFAQSEWTYVVTGKAGEEGLTAYYVSGDPAFTLKKGDEVTVSEFRDDFPVKDAPGETRRGAVITADMEDYIVYLDEEGVLVPKSEYRYERIVPGLGSLVNRNSAKSPVILFFGLGYLLMMLYASRGFLYIQLRPRRLEGAAGWIFFALYLVLLVCEAAYLLMYSNPLWFMSFSEAGIVKGVLFLLLMIVYLYLKYAVTCLAMYPLRNTRLLQDSEFDSGSALLIAAVGTWLILSMAYWEAAIVPYLMGIVAVATVAGIVWVLRKAFRQAGPLLSLGILLLMLVSGATLCYLACEVLAFIIQIVVVCYCLYALISVAGMKSSSPGVSDPDHTTYIDYEGNAHDLYRQADGTYVDYRDNSRWNKIHGANSDRFDRIS